MGEDPDREGLRETPARVARMYAELFSGLHEDPRMHLRKFFTEKYDEVVLVRDISFNSMCEHHMLPFMGVAHIGYVPNGRVLGLSKLARVVEVVARRPQVQERMTETIANLLEEELEAKGVAVIIEASAHLHDHPRHPQARQLVRHLGHEGPVPSEPVEPFGNHEPDLRRATVTGVSLLVQFIYRDVLRAGAGEWRSRPPRQVTSGYYRNHLYVLLGLNVLATLAAGRHPAIGLPWPCRWPPRR